MTKHIPNLLTISRIAVSLPLLFLAPFSPAFYICYSWCGISDILDGYLARKTNSLSKWGAVLDSLADFALIGIVAAVLLSTCTWKPWMYFAALLILFVRLASVAVGFIRFRRLGTVHTWLNKLTGSLLFLSLYFIEAVEFGAVFLCLCLFAGISALEELLIVSTAETWNPNQRHLCFKSKK